MLALGRLLRLSLATSAVADVAVGLALGSHGRWLPGFAPWVLILSSACVYHGAMALNDWADRVADARERPDRPIPSGAVAPAAALALGLALLASGVLLAASVDPRAGGWLGAIAACALIYDLIARGPWLGPTLLAICRGGNLALGLLAPFWLSGEALPPDPMLVAPAILYGAYVFFLSRLARLEDEEDPRPLASRPRRELVAASLCLAGVPFVGLFVHAHGDFWGTLASAVLAWSGASGLLRVAATTKEWTRERVGRATAMALRRLLIFTASCALLGVTWSWVPGTVAALSLAGYPVSYGLRRVFPPT